MFDFNKKNIKDKSSSCYVRNLKIKNKNSNFGFGNFNFRDHEFFNVKDELYFNSEVENSNFKVKTSKIMGWITNIKVAISSLLKCLKF